MSETANRTTAEGAVLGDLAFWKSLEPLGHKWRQFDKDAGTPQVNSYVGVMATKQLKVPAILYLDMNGKVLDATALPATTAEIRAKIKALTGK